MYFSLLKDWCDALTGLQLTQITDPSLYGGILCPACGRIHGRCGDAIYPMLFMAVRTGETKYLDCAKRLFLWSENMVNPDGSYRNDTNSDWNGITVFAVTQLAEALHGYSRLLDAETCTLWTRRLRIGADYLLGNAEKIGGNVNYPVTAAYAMAAAGHALNDGRYIRKAHALAQNALHYITPEGLLYGEGKPWERITPKGCRPMDLGYNVEESLPALLAYAELEQDEAVRAAAEKALLAHLAFMLPDGAWDNSWGTRNNKWSYWGSRTSDGCLLGYGLLAEKYPACGEAVRRNTQLLRACTQNGLLCGGPMYADAGERPCVHHTICHAKALASLLEHGIEPAKSAVPLPRETQAAVVTFPMVHVSLLSKGPWRATVSDYDFEYSSEGHATGGAVTMLWHESLGPVFAGTMTKYALVEPNNMQLPQYLGEICLTPRLEYAENGAYYRSINDLSAIVSCTEAPGAICVHASGRLCDAAQAGERTYSLRYTLTDSAFEIAGQAAHPGAVLHLPVISGQADRVRIPDACTVILEREKGRITLRADRPLRIRDDFPQKAPLTEKKPAAAPEYHRVFNPVGGFEALPVCLDAGSEPFSVAVTVENA